MTMPPSRIRAFDWLRGLAVLFMIQCHALTLLLPSLRESRMAGVLLWVDGLVAPSFIFSAGFFSALVQVRGASPGSRARRIRKSLRRIIEVLGVATLVNWAWFPILREPKWVLRIDILQCIGVSLLIALPLFALLATRPNVLRWVSLGLALVIFLVAPYAEAVRGPFTALANGSTDSVFPLLPWAGYVFLGASAGALSATGDIRALVKWLIGLAALGGALFALKPFFIANYPPHAFWVTDPANHGERWLLVCLLVLVLLAVEHRVSSRALTASPVRFVEVFGASSLSGYFFHEMLLYYQVFGFCFDGWWGRRSSWLQYSLLTAVIIALTYALVLLTDRAYRWWNRAIDVAMVRVDGPSPGAPSWRRA